MDDMKNDFYQNLRAKLRAWSQTDAGRKHKYVEYIVLAPDLFHLLCRLALDKDVQTADKAKLAAAIAYFVSPIDLLPEALLGPLGFVDDIALAVYVLNAILNNTDPEVIRRHWAGDGDILELIQNILKKADEMIGSGLWAKLKKLV
jgi:uncharacterized membrane protein YkvA (DUF1232 family)